MIRVRSQHGGMGWIVPAERAWFERDGWEVISDVWTTEQVRAALSEQQGGGR